MTRLRSVAIVAGLAAAGVLLWRLRPDATKTPDTVDVDEPAAVARLAAWAPSPPATPLSRLAGYVWASPLTAAGLLLAALSGTAPQVRDGVLVFAPARGLGGRMLRWRGFSAATLGHVIIAAERPSPRLLRHEMTHVRQAERWGPLFAPLYLAGLLRYGYRRNPFERAAYAAANARDGRKPSAL